MKKSVLLLALMSVSVVSLAETDVSLSYGQKNLVNGTQNHVVTVATSSKINDSFAINTSAQGDSADSTNSVTTRLEVGGTYTYKITDMFSANVKTMVGQKQKSGSNSFEILLLVFIHRFTTVIL